MIRVENLRKEYGDFCAVDSLSFEIKKGEITGLLGPNGAGKTTTMRMITGFISKTSGDIFIGDKEIEGREVEVKKMIGYLPESAPLYPDMMVYDYMHYLTEIHEIDDSKNRIIETAELCGLKEVMHKNISELSKGYRQRVGLAHAIIHDPEILILDEPTTGLDPNQIIEIRKLIRNIGKSKTVILSTHILQEVEAACDRVIIINQGNIVADGTTAEIKEGSSGDVETEITLAEASFEEVNNQLCKLEEVKSVELKKNNSDIQFTIIVRSSADVENNYFLYKEIKKHDWIIVELKQNENSLERVFSDLTSGGHDE